MLLRETMPLIFFGPKCPQTYFLSFSFLSPSLSNEPTLLLPRPARLLRHPHDALTRLLRHPHNALTTPLLPIRLTLRRPFLIPFLPEKLMICVSLQLSKRWI